MPHKIRKVLILGSGGLRIGQAGEFDYSGSQAIKAMKEEGIKVILLNPNVATVQTDKGLADKIYFLPVSAYFAEKIIAREKPDAILLGFGGQTALNVGLELEESGVLAKHKVRVLGTPVSAIRDTEDRALFKERLGEIGVKVARSEAARSVSEGLKAAKRLGYPVMARSAFTLGGANSGVAKNSRELKSRLEEAFKGSSQVLIEECLAGWKEIEYEIVRDCYDNCIAVCNMENFDPMGIHTGESIVVAPSQTLNNEEYHFLREVAIKTVRHLGIVGECNIQYALNPQPDVSFKEAPAPRPVVRSFSEGRSFSEERVDYRVIEVNARLSRSSALASKATGYPLAFVAAKLALGYGLPEIKNSVTQTTSACFEPALDYLVLKMPRWDLTKFKMSTRQIGSEMKSVGEVMAIGKKFEEVLQKALRMLAIGANGLVCQENGNLKVNDCEEEIKNPTDRRIFALAQAMQKGMGVEKAHALSAIDPWFLEKLKNVVDLEKKLKKNKLSPGLLKEAKQLGFSDRQIGLAAKKSEEDVRSLRKRAGIRPVIKQIDTLAGEFPAKTNYLYLTYNGSSDDVSPSGRQAMAVLGSGPYCIGSSVEFDWCAVQAVRTLGKAGYDTIMVNCNPETVSTDYDTASRLYFEELSLERVRDICEFENPRGMIVSVGGQIANNLAMGLEKSGVRIMGTRPSDIDRAEDRHKFSDLLDKLGIDQPLWAESTDTVKAKEIVRKLGYPVLIRPSYVLSGTAMNMVFSDDDLDKYLDKAVRVSDKYPVVISKFIENSREIEIDGVADRGRLAIYAITEHVENAGTHSGDATVVLPPQRTYLETVRRAKKTAKDIIRSLNITGPFNIQFLAKDNQIKVIECNLRASRSFPFVSKATKYNFMDIAVRAMLGQRVRKDYKTLDLDYVAVKSPQFSYGRIRGADPVSYVEMASTGEAASFGDTFSEALLKAMISAERVRFPRKNILLSVGGEENKVRLLSKMKSLSEMGFRLLATEHTADFLAENGVKCKKVYKIHHHKHPNVADVIASGDLDLVINIPHQYLKREVRDGFIIRRRAVDFGVPLITNLQIAIVFVSALKYCPAENLKIKSWAEY